MKPITIIIIDDHKLLRETWSFILNNDRRFTVLADIDSGEKGVELCRIQRPDIVLLDINLPGMDGVETTPLIRKYSPGTKVIAVSQHTQPAYTKKIMQKGASGYITKTSTRDEMIKGIIAVYKGEKYICTEIKNIISNQMFDETDHLPSLNSLSIRELEIIDYLKQGLTSREIASTIYISSKTVEVHRYNILRKLKMKNTTQLINYATQVYS